MTRCKTFRYASRTRIRALEIFHRADGNVSTHEIIAKLEEEGHGEVSRNAVERWLREDTSRRAVQAAALGQRLRHQAQAADGEDHDAVERILSSAQQVADLLAVTAKRATKQIPAMEIRTPDEFARVASSLRDLMSATIEGFRLVDELRKLSGGHVKKSENT